MDYGGRKGKKKEKNRNMTMKIYWCEKNNKKINDTCTC